VSDWRPTAPLSAWQLRARLLAESRQFFAERAVLEVETPLLGRHAVTDPHLSSIAARDPESGADYFLQTSPEYAMKRMLAAGAPDIYQIGKAFRGGEHGRNHNLEFTLIEWYRRGFSMHALMDEVESLLERLLGRARLGRRERVRYRDAVHRELGIDPLSAPLPTLAAAARDRVGLLPEGVTVDRDLLLDLLMAVAVGPKLGGDGLTFVYAYPASQAALARVATDGTAARFEAYLDGLELCNGFEELGDPAEQQRRFEADREIRALRGRPSVAPDQRLLAALAAGLPDCAGVALGFDRVLMLAAHASDISSVLTFPTEMA
jgi:elongation factor P--(R)-beta-lysine ligase